MSWGQQDPSPVCFIPGGLGGTSSSPSFLSGQDVFALPQPLWWFSLFQNSMIPTGLAWEDMLYPLYQKYKNAITWGDQDLLNIIFYFNPGRLSCENAICVGVRPPRHPEHIPARSVIDWAWMMPGFPVKCALSFAHTTTHASRPRLVPGAALPLLTQKAKCWTLQHWTPFLEHIF